jgi:hypothetical protein
MRTLTVFRMMAVFAGSILLLYEAPLLYSRQMLVPNTGSYSPGMPPGGQSSELGQVPTNPAPYARPGNTPPTYFSNSCASGYHGSLNSELNARINPDVDFNTTYQCYARINPNLEGQQAGTAAPGQQPGKADKNSKSLPPPMTNTKSNTVPPMTFPNSGFEAIPGIRNNSNESTGAGTGPSGSFNSSGSMGSVNIQ